MKFLIQTHQLVPYKKSKRMKEKNRSKEKLIFPKQILVSFGKVCLVKNNFRVVCNRFEVSFYL